MSVDGGGGYGGWGNSNNSGYGGGDSSGGVGAGGASFGSYNESTGANINVGDYGLNSNQSGYGYNPGYDYGGGATSVGGLPDNSFTQTYAPTSDYSYAAPEQFASYAAPELPSWNGSYGLTDTPSNFSAVNTQNPNTQDDQKKSWMDRMRGAGIGLLGLSPSTARAGAVLGAGANLADGNISNAVGGLTSMFTGNGLYGNVAGLATDAAMGKPVGDKAVGSALGWLGGTVGAGLGGPLGGMLGSQVGGWLNNSRTTNVPGQYNEQGGGSVNVGDYGMQPSQSGNYMGNGSSGGGMNMGAVLAGLGGLYGLQQNKMALKGIQGQQNGQQQMFMDQMQNSAGPMPEAPGMVEPNMAGVSSKLDAMFGAGSESANQLRSQLERKDAAAGRRSQYGPREVQMLTQMAQLRAQAEPSYMNAETSAANAANQGAYNIYNTQMNSRNSELTRMIQAQQLNQQAGQNSFANSQARNTTNMQQLATLYGVGKETGFNDWLGGLFK